MSQWPSFEYEVNGYKRHSDILDDDDDDDDDDHHHHHHHNADSNSVVRLVTRSKTVFRMFLLSVFYQKEGRVNSENTETNKHNKTKSIAIKIDEIK